MGFNLYYLSGILGLIFIICGTFLIASKRNIRRRFIYPLLLIGGILLEIYSIYIRDSIFIILQGVYIIVTIFGLIKVNEKYLKHKK